MKNERMEEKILNFKTLSQKNKNLTKQKVEMEVKKKKESQKLTYKLQ